MEQRKPHTPLNTVKALVRAGNVSATITAKTSALELGFNKAGMVEVVLSLTMKDFYKSMTTNADHTIWQDVYRPMTQAGALYVKLTVIENVLIVSFKAL